MRTFRDRTALITGAAGGIGTALAKALLAEGAHLALVDVDEERLGALVAELDAGERRVSCHVMDVRDAAAWDATAAAVREVHGGLSLAILAAGLTVHGPFVRHAAADIDRVIDVNLRGTAHGVRALWPLLREADEAHVVTVASLAGLLGVPQQSTYSASKWAVRGLSAALRVELATDGIGVTTVLPGTTATPFLSRAGTHDAGQSAWMARQMLRFGASPDRVARAVLRGVRRDRAEVRVGWDTHATAAVMRWTPGVLPAALSLLWRRLGPGRETP